MPRSAWASRTASQRRRSAAIRCSGAHNAAIAANAALGLMEPTGSGMGGDLFALIWDPKQNKVVGLNASGRAPKGQTLDDLVIPAFAVVREASRRVLGMRPFDVQLTGGMILNDGAIAEMKTGEGKTLVATLPVFLNALEGIAMLH